MTIRRRSRYARLAVLPLSAAVFVGCAQQSHQPPPSKFASGPDMPFGSQSADFDLGPKDLLARVAQMLPGLGLPIEQQTKDTVVTGWEPHVGDWHIMRHWQERTRYRLTVIPDSDDPTGRSRLQVDEETQQRAASVQEFENAGYLHRPDRAKALLDKIKQQIPAAAPGTARRTTPRAQRQPAAAQPAPAVTVRADDARYRAFGDAELAVLRTDPNTGATQALLRTTRDARVPAHALTTGTSFTVIAGSATVTVDGTPTVLSPGGFTYAPRGSNTEIVLGANTKVLITTDGPWDSTWGK